MVRVDSSNVQVPGPPSALDHAVSMRYAGSLRAYVKNLDLNAAAPIDLDTVYVRSSLYVPILAMVYGPTANLSSATLALYSAPAGGGVAVIAPTLLGSLTGVGTYQPLAIAALASPLTTLVLYPRLTVAAGVAGTANLMIEFADLSLI